MRLLLDEHLSPAIAEQLRGRGHDVVAAIEVGVIAIDDSRVLDWAVSDRRAVVTNNIGDFRQLHAAYLTTSKAHYGLILVPTSRYSFVKTELGPLIMALDAALREHPSDDALCDRELFL